ncbi:MAG TPA: helix-turn-helix domain-containing protein, partial [Actinomycetota bacterium]|nr:helix-turn-helix domain-containing protein [Actinomycetota bacterium]
RPGQLLNLSQVAERLNVSERYVRHLVSNRRIANVKIGGLIRFTAEAVEELIERGTRTSG